jgi:endonuclease/exonuclease/phosphatase (EEP) superfamily protein YafD
MKKKTPILTIVVCVYMLLLCAALGLRNVFILELFISLLPYWLLLNIGFIGIITLRLLINRRTISYSPLAVFAMAFFCSLTANLFLQFYQYSFVKIAEGEGKRDVKIAFFNKLYSNTQYDVIDTTLTNINPDVIGLTEIKRSDIGNIPALTKYQCSLVKDARNDAAIAFFSKYPCALQSDVFANEYILPLTLQVHETTYHVFVVHPLPPGTPQWLAMRNTELFKLRDHIAELKTDNVMVLGDFNLSPWSPMFKQLTETQQLKNVAQGQGIVFSWNGGIIKTLIDHIYVPKKVAVQSFASEHVPGSDHHLIWTALKM